MLRGEKFNESCDVYSFAIVIWEIMAWDEPYPGLSSQTVMRGVSTGRLRPEKLPHIPEELWTLLQTMWSATPSKRPDFRKTLKYLERYDRALKKDDI